MSAAPEALVRPVELVRELQRAASGPGSMPGETEPPRRATQLGGRGEVDEAAALLATVLAGVSTGSSAWPPVPFAAGRSDGTDDQSRRQLWAAATGLPPDEFPNYQAAGQSWQSAPTLTLTHLFATDHARAEQYAAALAELAAAAARVEPLDLSRVNVAAFIAAAQLRALAPEHGQLPPRSVVPIIRGVGGYGMGGESEAAFAATPPAQPGDRATLAAAGSASEASTPTPKLESYAELLAQLDALVGLDSVKEDVRRQAELLRVARIRGARGMKNPEVTRHLVFTGNPGTGKTTVARLVAKIYCSLGLLERGHLVELDRTGLVGGYLGQSEAKTADAVQRALGGVLFIDEAYALAGDQYGDAAIAVLVKAMEDHRDDLVLIAAGYTDRMQEFLDMNPGLSSRLRLTIFFPDYSDDQLIEIFGRLAAGSDYSPSDDCWAAVRGLVAAEPRDESFGNARFVRKCFEAALVRQAWRLRDVESPTDEQLRTLIAGDVERPTPADRPVAPS